MTVKEELHQLVDSLSDEEARLWMEALSTGDAMLIGMALAPVDDEASSTEEDAGADDAWHEYLQGKALTAEEAKQRFLA